MNFFHALNLVIVVTGVITHSELIVIIGWLACIIMVATEKLIDSIKENKRCLT